MRFVAFLVFSALATSLCSLEDDVRSCPPVPNFARFFPEVPPLGRKLRVACPCIGIDGCGHALQSMGCPTQVFNAYDLEPSYFHALQKHFRDMGMEVIDLHLGEKLGNLVNVALNILRKPIDFVISGPPCPPWSGQGKRKGCNDDRAKVFMAVVCWIVFLISCGGLLGCVLENVVGMTHETTDGREPPSTVILRALRNLCPEFHWRLDKLDLTKYMLPQTRARIFFRGMRKTLAACVPPPLKEFGSRTLREALGRSPNMIRSALTPDQQMNVRYFENEIKAKFAEGKFGSGDLVVCRIDRSNEPNIVYEAGFTLNNAPTLTCHSTYLAVLSVSCVVGDVEDDQRDFFRFLTKPERLALQGFPPELAMDLPEEKICFASGNAYPIPLIIAVLHPMLMTIASCEQLDFPSWPAADDITEVTEASVVKQVRKAFADKGKIVNKKKHNEAKQRIRRKKKRHRSSSS